MDKKSSKTEIIEYFKNKLRNDSVTNSIEFIHTCDADFDEIWVTKSQLFSIIDFKQIPIQLVLIFNKTNFSEENENITLNHVIAIDAALSLVQDNDDSLVINGNILDFRLSPERSKYRASLVPMSINNFLDDDNPLFKCQTYDELFKIAFKTKKQIKLKFKKNEELQEIKLELGKSVSRFFAKPAAELENDDNLNAFSRFVSICMDEMAKTHGDIPEKDNYPIITGSLNINSTFYEKLDPSEHNDLIREALEIEDSDYSCSDKGSDVSNLKVDELNISVENSFEKLEDDVPRKIQSQLLNESKPEAVSRLPKPAYSFNKHDMSPNFYSTMTNDQSPANVRQSKRKIPYNSNWMSESEYQQRLNRGNSYKNIVKQNLSKISTFKDLKIRVLSWNINSKVDSTMFLDEWILPEDLKYEKPDIFVFGFQEVDLSIGSVALNKTSSSLLEDRWVELIESSCDNLLNQKLRKILRNSKKDETDRSYYIQLKRVRMAGILLILYVSEKFKISHRIFDVAVSSIPTGIMNMMGNKGAVAMRFNYYNSSICIVNCHLAAGEGNIERRKQDFAEITRKLQFNLSTLNNKEGKRLTITDHDYIIFFGDLNFRLNTFNLDDVMKCIEQKRYDRLLEVDEIRSMSHELSNLDEAKIDFPPTYKFIVGTQRYDIGEKGRTPAYCDRILYQGENIKVDNYRSHASYTNSDHKPISAMVKIGAYRINRNLFNSFLDRLVHREDRELNKKLPQAVVTPLDVDFGQVQFFKIYEKEITITNTGQVDLEYIFQNDREVKMPDWMTVFPMKKVLKKGYSNVISIKIGIKDIHVAKLNKSGDRMSTILVLKLLEGKDIFICIYFNFQPTCFGLSLKTLVDIGDRPVGKIPHEELLQIINEARDRPDVAETPPLITFDTEEETEDTSKDFYIPKEIFRMVDFIKERIETPYLYERPGTETLFLSIQHTLNTTTVDQPFAEDIDVHTMISILNIFLSTIEDSIIPQKFQQAFIENSHKIQICMSIIATLPIINQNLIWYLLKFFNFTLKHSSLNGTSSVDIAKNYAEIFFRDDSANRSWDEKVICLQKMIEFQDL